MSDPLVQVNWEKAGPLIKGYFVVILGELIGFVMIALSEDAMLFAGWVEVGMALLGGLLMQIILEWTSDPPKPSNRKKRQLNRLIAGVAYGLGAVNIIEIFERVVPI